MKKASLNHIFRSVWSEVLNTWVAVSELVSAKGKRSGSSVLKKALIASTAQAGGTTGRNGRFRIKPLALAVIYCLCSGAQANPIGAQIVNGAAAVNQVGNTLTVTNSPNAIINWQGFGIAPNETTRFIQQSATSSVLNRVVGPDPSQLLGTLTSNGRVFLVNPSGILVGQGARIDVAGFVASTLNLSNEDFLAGKLNFTSPLPQAGEGQGVRVVNQGTITTPEGGTIYLVAPQVENSGIITTPKGETLLAAGNTVQLIDTGAPGVSVQVTGATSTATNLGRILADSGRIGMVAATLKNSGTLSASSLVSEGGRVFLRATQSATHDGAGRIEATGARGGVVEVLGDRVVLDGESVIDASGRSGGGTILVGGDAHGANPGIRNAQTTFVGSGVTLRADATQGGDGGKVVVWSDMLTVFKGFISAVGGAIFGDGGWVEVSGKKKLSFLGAVDTTAPRGRTGALLLDPTDITISSAPSAASMVNAAGTFSDASTTPSNLNVTDLQTQLGLSNVIVSTASGLGGTGHITVVDPVTWASANSLTLSASGNIAINAALTGTNGGLVLAAPTGTVTGANGVILVDKLLVTSSGNVLLPGLNQVNTLAANTAGTFSFENNAAGGLTIGAVGATPGVTASGDVAIRQYFNGGITANESVVSSAGNVIVGVASGAGTATVAAGKTVSGNSVQVYSAGGNVSILGALTGATSANLHAGTGAISTGGTGLVTAPSITLQNDPVSAGAIGAFGSSLNTSSPGGVGNANIWIGASAYGASAVYLSHAGDATLQQVFTAGAATPVDIYASGNLTAASISTGTASMNLSAGAGGGKLLTVPNGAALSGANITLVADRMNLAGAASSINAGTGLLWLHPISTAWNVGLGSAVDNTANTLELSAAELDTLAGSGTLRIGGSVYGNISLTGPVAPAGFGAGTLSLWSGGTLTQATAADIITANSLTIRALGNVTLNTAANAVTNLAAQVGDGTHQNSNFSFKNSGALNVGSNIDGVSGVSIAIDGVNFNYASPNGVIALASGGALTQSAGTTLAGKAVYAEGSKVVLTQANPTGVIAGKSTGSAAGDIFSYTSSNAIMATTVNGFGGILAAAPPDPASVVLSGGGAGISQDGTGVINAGGGAGGLNLVTAGPVNLASANNNVGAFKAPGVSSLDFYNAGALTVGIAGNGVTASTMLTVTAAGALTVAAPASCPACNVFMLAPDIQIGSAGNAGISISGGFVNLKANKAAAAGTISTAGTSSSTLTSSTGIVLEADNLSFPVAPVFNATNEIVYQTFSDNRSITVGASCNAAAPSCLLVNGATNNAPDLVIGNDVVANTNTAGIIYIDSAITHAPGRVALLTGGSVIQAAPAAITATGLGVSAGGPVALNANNAVTNLVGQTTGGNFVLVNSQSLNVTTMTGGTGIHTHSISGVSALGGNVILNAVGATSDLTLLGTFVSSDAAGNAVVLSAGRGFYNTAGSISLAGAGAPRWLVYAASPGVVTKGGLTSAFRHYGGTYGTYAPASVTETGNGFIYASAPGALSVNTTLASGTAGNTYGVAPTASFGYTLSGFADSEDTAANIGLSGSAAFTPALSSTTPAGSYTVSYSGGLSSTVGYTFTAGAGLAYTVDPAVLAIVTAALTGTASKTYDGTTTAALAPGNFLLSGFVGTDSATVTKTTGVYAGKNVGSGILVSTTLASSDFSPVGGTSLANYTLPTSASGNIGVITPAPLTLSGVTAGNKVYDGATAATLTGGVLAGILGADVVNLAGQTGAFLDKNAGLAKTVNISGITLGGADAGNYTVSAGAIATADIAPATISAVTGIVANNKVYDATTAATLNTAGAAFTGMIAGDVLAVGAASGAFADKNAGVAKPVAISGITLAGADAGNYTLAAATAGATADITPAPLAITGLVAANKVYDGTTSAVLTGTPAITALTGDVVTLGGAGSGAFADKNAGIAKPVTVSGYILAGIDAGNYTLAQPAGFAADITPATIGAVTGIVANNKVYDATTAATLNTAGAAFTGMVAGDVLTVGAATGAFVDKNAGVAKPVAISGITLAGADAGNYILSANTAGATADITPATISAVIGIVANNKVYDATTAATLNTAGATFAGMIAGDMLAVGTAIGAFADPLVGTLKPVSITGITLAGVDAGNYTLLSSTAAATADITPATAQAAPVTPVIQQAVTTTTTATTTATTAATTAPAATAAADPAAATAPVAIDTSAIVGAATPTAAGAAPTMAGPAGGSIGGTAGTFGGDSVVVATEPLQSAAPAPAATSSGAAAPATESSASTGSSATETSGSGNGNAAGQGDSAKQEGAAKKDEAAKKGESEKKDEKEKKDDAGKKDKNEKGDKDNKDKDKDKPSEKPEKC